MSFENWENYVHTTIAELKADKGTDKPFLSTGNSENSTGKVQGDYRESLKGGKTRSGRATQRTPRATPNTPEQTDFTQYRQMLIEQYRRQGAKDPEKRAQLTIAIAGELEKKLQSAGQ